MSGVQACQNQHRCSCGRTFLNGISLERHRWVTQHAPADVTPTVSDTERRAAVRRALEILREKQAVQHNFDTQRRSRRRLRREIQKWQQLALDLGEQFYETLSGLGYTSLKLAVMTSAILTLVGLVIAGMKIGNFLSA